MREKVLILSLVSSLSAFAQTTQVLEFRGVIKDSLFKNLEGRECSVTLEKQIPQGAQTFSYFAYPKISGLNTLLNRRKAPIKKMIISDAFSNGSDDVLVGMGSKYSGEISQRLYVELDESKTSIISWHYLDGTVTTFGYTYSCEQIGFNK